MNREATHLLLESSGSDFFERLEEHLHTKIPVLIKNILLVMDIDRALLLATFDNDSITHIEQYMKSEFLKETISENEQMKDYLGKFESCQDKFTFSYGHKLMMNVMADACRNIVKPTLSAQNNTNSNIAAATVQKELATSLTDDELSYYENIDQPMADRGKMFMLYIGSLILTIFNDAKRLTLSSWSWPSRHVAAELSHHYKEFGDLVCNPTLYYITPSQHTAFLNSIVQSDVNKLADRIKNSLALSLRVDGSVDRTQDHNIYVMGHLVNKDGTVSTVFIGFEVPKQGKSLGYFECMKSVVEKILPWQLCLRLLSSIVTDGEELNMGRKSGLHIRLLNEIRRSISANQPLLSIWCFPHRINLAWQGVCKECPIIEMIIEDASSLSSYFHKSGEKTNKLKTAAAENRLKKPLRYATYFPTRWTEFVFKLLNATLRNWRAAMAYFIAEKEEPLEQRWLLYDRIHFMAFLTDVLLLFKKFQKEFESDTISILDVQKKQQKLLQEFEDCMNQPIDNGWEQLFLSSVDETGCDEDGPMFFGHELLRNRGRSTTTPTFAFNGTIRKCIIQSFIKNLNERLDYDAELQKQLKPLSEITSSTSFQSLQACYRAVVPDLNENEFYSDYTKAAHLLKDYKFETPIATLRKLQTLSPDTMKVLKIALARVVAAKPDSGDVERLISIYNKVKATDRTSVLSLTLYNYLHIKVNMPNLDQFDPSDATQHWMNQKNRRPAESETRKQQEYFKGVFSEADQHESTNNPVISF